MKLAGTYQYNTEFTQKLHSALCDSYSDKASMHEYHTVYAHILENITVSNFLEIGLFLNDLNHTDLNAWASVYPKANIYGGDIKTSQLFNRDNIKMCFVDQVDINSFTVLKEEFPVEFDVIIDDASHIYNNTINTLTSLFSVVKDGGVYIIEDCQSDHPDNNDWQQTISEILLYLEENNYTYEVFQSRKPDKKRDEETGEETDIDAASDDYIICIYK